MDSLKKPGFFSRVKDNILNDDENMTLIDSTPIGLMHVGMIMVFFVPFSWFAVAVCAFLYLLRVFALTGGYHRYFSHNSYKTGRVFQFMIAFIGGMSAQLGALWWAAHHRHHHQYSDTEHDIHSPGRKGFFWAHIGWVMCRKYAKTELERIPDFAKYPELRFLDRLHAIPPVLMGIGLYFLGDYLGARYPALHTSGWQLVAWGFFVSTVLVYHATFCINSLTHMIGNRRFNTTDQSRNSLILALVTLGEGWHNNHHRYPVSTRQGFYWWEIDMTYYVLKMLQWMGVVWDIRPPPEKIYREAEEVPVLSIEEAMMKTQQPTSNV
jgi:stearoyl-CoA desaturase (Delta-9 desaturase)